MVKVVVYCGGGVGCCSGGGTICAFDYRVSHDPLRMEVSY